MTMPWKKYGEGDTIGCGYVRSKKAVYFTLNGKRLGEPSLFLPPFSALRRFVNLHNMIGLQAASRKP